MNATLEFMDVFNAADCAARVIASNRVPATEEESSRRCASFLRRPAIELFRVLWRQADTEARMTLAMRLHVWLETGRAKEIGERLKTPAVTAP
jgi:hypothetical protein